MPKAFFPVLAFVFVLLAATGGSGVALGASSGGASKPAEFLKAEQEIKSGNFEAAIPLLEGLVAKNAKDPDSLNYLGYSHRKLGQFEVAEDYYGKALAINPEHRGALEYLGELYLQTNRPEKAHEMLARLDDACFWGCDEYDELKEAIERHASGGAQSDATW